MQARKLSTLPVHPFRLSLSIRHPSIDPAQISRELKCEADESFAAGQPRKSRSGMAATSVHGESYWVAALDARFWRFGRAERVREHLLAQNRDSDPGKVENLVNSVTESVARMAADAANSASNAIFLTCAHLLFRHGVFLRRLRSEGGTLCLAVTLSKGALPAFRITPELGRWLSELGITLDLEFTGD
ncbi:MAG TPA: hypothetical protein VHX52_10140 [Steroidobacteraceae bacterium]|jgi:hypothetical protein|nr:hypothetical protein [Steroidobacteraceae bacterium]